MLTAAEWRNDYGSRWAIELTVLALLLSAASYVAPLADPDLPMHLALGEWIVNHGTVPRVEPFAWTRAGEPFFAYSWLPEVAFYAAYRAGGIVGLKVLQGGAVFVMLAAIFLLARWARWSIWTAIVLASLEALMAMVLAPYLRPQVVLLTAVPLAWGAAMRLVESERPARWAAIIVLLSALAANSHLLFPLIAAPWLLLLLRWPGRARGALLIGATLAGWFINPYAFDLPAVLALNFADNALFNYPTPIAELTPGVQAAFDGSGTLMVTVVALGLLPWVAAPQLARRERIIWGAVWLIGLIGFALAVRALLVWWMLVLPLAAMVVEPVARAPRRRSVILTQRAALGALVLLLAMARARMAAAPWAAPTGAARSFTARSAPFNDPVAEWLACHTDRAIGGRTLVGFALGSYLNWRYPTLSYSIDSRNIFPDSVAEVEGYALASAGLPPLGPWKSADLAIIAFRYPVTAVLDTAAGWSHVLTVTPPADQADSVGVWVTDRWWARAASGGRPPEPTRLSPGANGVRQACRSPASPAMRSRTQGGSSVPPVRAGR